MLNFKSIDKLYDPIISLRGGYLGPSN